MDDVAGLTPVRQVPSLHQVTSREQRSISPHSHSICHTQSPDRLTQEDNRFATLESMHDDKIATASPRHHVAFLKSSLDPPDHLTTMLSSIPPYVPHSAPVPEEQAIAAASTTAPAPAAALVSDV